MHGPLCIQVDVHKMAQVLRKLVSNAFKYTKRKGSVSVRAYMEESAPLSASASVVSE